MFACVGLLLTAAGCGDGEVSTTSAANSSDTRLGLLVPDSTSDTWSVLTDAAVNEGVDSQVDVSPDVADDADVTAQVNKIEAFLPEDLDCFAVAPVDSRALVRPLQAFAKKGVPLFNIGLRLDEGATKAAKLPIASFIGPNDVEIGQRAAREMIAAVPAGGTVVMVVGDDSDLNAAQQRSAFTKSAAGKFDVVTTAATNDDYTAAVTVIAETLTASPGIRGVFASSDLMGRAAAKAIAQLSLASTVKVISVGGTQEGLRAVKSGELTATVATYPALVGAIVVRACRQVADGRNVKPRLTTQSWLVNRSNVDAELGAYPDPTQPFPDPFV